MMRIAMLSTPFVAVPPSTYGGTELVVHELAEGLSDAGHEVTLFATGDSAASGDLRFLYPEHRWPPEPLSETNHVSWAMAEIAAGGFDLIHAHSALALGMSRLVPTPMVYTIHHAATAEFSDFYSFFPDVNYVAISSRQRALEIPLPKCHVVHHGLDPRRYDLGIPGDYVCFVARLADVKGPHTAIDAAERAGVPIRVAGGVHHPDRAFFEQEVASRLRLPHVTFLGEIGSEEKRPLLARARALLAPIEWEEPFGLIMIEAMLSGCPVVAFPRGSVMELVEPGLTGFIVHSPEEMVEAIRPGGIVDSFDRPRCRERAIERFSRARLAEAHLRLYERVLDERASLAASELLP